jgi:carbamoyl-phosphate synthase large subunit
VVGLVNLQFAIQRDAEGKDHVFVIEVNPRASRTVPYVSKATGIPLAKVAARLMTGRKLASCSPSNSRAARTSKPARYYVKSPVFPWNKFAGVDTVLGPEMRSTGEVMGVAATFGEAFAKAQLSAGQVLPAAARSSSASTTTTRKPPSNWRAATSSWLQDCGHGRHGQRA